MNHVLSRALAVVGERVEERKRGGREDRLEAVAWPS